MNKQTLFPQIAIRVAALALGAAFVSAPAFAQNYGRNVNDGGIPPEPAVSAPAATKSQNKVVSQQPAYYGRNVDDGGMPPEPTAAAKAAASSHAAAQKPAAPAQYGRNVNDGGQVTMQ
jgi:hypothetical protein